MMADHEPTARPSGPADPPAIDRPPASGSRAQSPAPTPPPGPLASRSSQRQPDDLAAGGDDQLSLLRRDVADLRHAIDDLSDRVELRQVRAAVEDLRSEVIALRRVVVEWPELEQLITAVGSLRSDVADLRTGPLTASDPAAQVALTQLREAVGRLQVQPGPLAALAPVIEEIGTLREEMVSLRRRIALRASVDHGASTARIEELLEAVLEHLSSGWAAPPHR